jgi:hypothetical protein
LIRRRNNNLLDSVPRNLDSKDRTMNKLAFAPLGLLTRAGRSLAAQARAQDHPWGGRIGKAPLEIGRAWRAALDREQRPAWRV